jgi:hypothetical protein
LVVQAVRHFEALHLYVLQSPELAVHEPDPLQVPRRVNVESEAPSVHVSAPQFVVGVGNVQALAFTPSQVIPHVVPAPVPVHAGRDPTGAPFTGEQVPTSPPTLHAWHWPPHPESQHTPSTQKLEPHSLFAEHATPFALAQ